MSVSSGSQDKAQSTETRLLLLEGTVALQRGKHLGSANSRIYMVVNNDLLLAFALLEIAWAHIKYKNQ